MILNIAAVSSVINPFRIFGKNKYHHGVDHHGEMSSISKRRKSEGIQIKCDKIESDLTKSYRGDNDKNAYHLYSVSTLHISKDTHDI